MKRITNGCRNQIRQHARGNRRALALFLALAMVVSLGVDLSTTSLAYANETVTEITSGSTDDNETEEFSGTTWTSSDSGSSNDIDDENTSNDEYYCGLEEHVHDDSCYETYGDPICGEKESEETNGHEHTLECYAGVEPTCGIEAEETHHHDLGCYGDKVLTCDDDHEHTAECYELGEPTCDKDETDGHEHTLACYENATPTCGLTAGEGATSGHTHTADCYNKRLVCGETEHTHSDKCKSRTLGVVSRIKKAISKVTTDADALMTTSDDASNAAITGLDITDHVTYVVLQKKDGVKWVDATEFTTSDQVKVSLSFSSVDRDTIAANSNTIYVKLPEGMDCSKFKDETYNAYDGSTQSGTYTYQQDSDGNWYIALKLFDQYVQDAGETIGGSLEFSFEWTEDSITDDGETKHVEIGQWDGEIIIKKSDDDGGSSSGNKYGIQKAASSLQYDENGYVYVDYTITLRMDEALAAGSSLDLEDVLSGSGFEYVKDSVKSNANNSVNFGSTTTNGDGSQSTKVQFWGPVEAGTYTITYRVRSTSKIAIGEGTVADQLNNTIKLDKENDHLQASTWTKTSTGTIDKSGKYVSGSGTTYIDYTVYLNAGDIIKNLKTAATFKDTLPDELEWDTTDTSKAVKVEKYNIKGELIATEYAKVDGSNIEYTTSTGQYYYVITYRTKLKDTVKVPMGDGLTVTNKGTSTGGIEGSSESEITIPNKKLTKKYVQNSGNLQETSSGYIYVMKWTSKVDVSGSLEGYTYEDWSELNSNTGTEAWYPFLKMTDEQLAAIVIKDASGNAIDSKYYKIERSTHDINGVDCGLYKITFLADSEGKYAQGPITIEYETTADMSKYATASDIPLTNYASLTKDGETDKSQDSYTYHYAHDDRSTIYKFGTTANWSGSETSSETTIEPGQNSIPWNIVLNGGRTIEGKQLTVTDTIAEDLTFIRSSFDVLLDGDSQRSILDKVTWNYDDASHLLTVTVPKDAYGKTSSIWITYRTQLPDSCFANTTTASFSNKATVDIEGNKTDSSHTQNVTKEVVGKAGSFDPDTQRLTYNIVINAEGTDLVPNQDILTVDDTLTDTNDLGITLSSLQLFSLVKEDSGAGDGSVTIKPGSLITELEQVDASDTSKAVNTYTYNKDTNTFTAYVNDSHAYVLVAIYDVATDVTESVKISNKVTIEGNDKWSKEDKTTEVTQSTSGKTYTSDKFTLIKRDASDYSTLLSAAQFRLEEYSNGAWTTVTDNIVTSGESTTYGHVSTNIKRNTLYRLTEVSAPDGYVVDSTPYYFALVRLGTTATLPDSVPDDTTYYNKDTVKVYTTPTLGDDASASVSGKDKYADVIIDRYNKKDETKTEPGQIRVSKVWIDSSGNTVTDAATLDELSGVTVTLTKHVAEQNKTVTIKAGTWDNAQSVTITNVNNGAYLIANVGQYENQPKINDFSCTDTSVTMTDLGVSDGYHKWKIGPITQDCTIIQGTLAYVAANNFTTEGGTAATGTTDTVIGTVTLDSSNGWTYLWSNLDRSDGVKYSLVETSNVSGYTVSYQLNGIVLDAESMFQPGSSGDKVTVTNTANPVYELPSTGGTGTLLTYMLGCLAILVSMFAGYSTWRSGERRAR